MRNSGLESPLESVGSYQLLEQIGVGAMATVFRAQHCETQELVAVKVMRNHVARNPTMWRRFEEEFEAARMLEHPNIVKGLEFGMEGSTLYFVMELVDGENLSERVERAGPLKEEEIIQLGQQLTQGLLAAHQRNIIHRDVKPDNVLINSRGVAKLTDLGLAKNTQSDIVLTLAAQGLGTPHFMAPEQFEDARLVDQRADVYGLAATLYVALTGYMPFSRRGREPELVILRRKDANDLVPPRELVRGLSKHVDFALRRAMRADKEQRHKDCQEFLAALSGHSVIEEIGVPAPITGPGILRVRHEQLSAAKPQDRRRVERHSVAIPTICGPVARHHEITTGGRTHDLSTHGVRLMLRRRYEPGTLLKIEVRHSKTDTTAMLIGEVVWVQKSRSGLYTIACRFPHALSQSDLRVWL
ncbi:MAG: serine/threonine-protein kinase [Gemmataceae bacterium]